jgi:hypothetical protein
LTLAIRMALVPSKGKLRNSWANSRFIETRLFRFARIAKAWCSNRGHSSNVLELSVQHLVRLFVFTDFHPQRDYASSRGAAKASKVCVGTKLATYPWRITANSMEVNSIEYKLDAVLVGYVKITLPPLFIFVFL